MKEYYEVDDNGNIVNNHLLNEDDPIPTNHYPGWGDQLFYQPVWDYYTMAWKEGLTSAQIAELTKPPSTKPTESERIEALELAFMDLMMDKMMGDI